MTELAYRVGREAFAVMAVSFVAIIFAPVSFVPVALLALSSACFVAADVGAALRGERVWFFRNLR